MEAGEPARAGLLLGWNWGLGAGNRADLHRKRVLKDSVRSVAGDLDYHRAHSVRKLRIQTAALSHHIVLIGGEVFQRFHQAARPADHNLVRLRRLPQSEMQT